MQNQKTIALVPAYNEEPRLAAVLKVITTSPRVDETIVIDDGSRDGTSQAAAPFPVKVVRLQENCGKGAALQAGLQEAGDAARYLFLDADLLNLRHAHIAQLLDPLTGDHPAAMTVGAFRQGRKTSVNLAQQYFSILNGQRALHRDFVAILPDLRWSRFGVEILLSRYAQLARQPVAYPELQGISHVTKEEKLGFTGGFLYRLRMYQECLYALFYHKNMIKKYPGRVPAEILQRIE